MSTPAPFWNWLQQFGRDAVRGLAMNACARGGQPIPPELLVSTDKPKVAAASPATTQPG